LTLLWQFDVQKAKFSLLAKAYSIIRDFKGKVSAPLDLFLASTCPRIGIVAPASYLNTFGWQVRADDEGKPSLQRMQSQLHLDPTMSSTNLSVHDLIEHYKESGYISADDLFEIELAGKSSSTDMLTMASVPTPRKNNPRRAPRKSKATTSSPLSSSASPPLTPSPTPGFTIVPGLTQRLINDRRHLGSGLSPAIPLAGGLMDGLNSHDGLALLPNNSQALSTTSYYDPTSGLPIASFPQTAAQGLQGLPNIDPTLTTGQHNNVPALTNNVDVFANDAIFNPRANQTFTDFDFQQFDDEFAVANNDFVYDPSGVDRFEASNISSFESPAAYDPSFWQL
jgi:hypothetical protein